MYKVAKIDFGLVRGIPIDSVLSHYGIQTKKRNNTYLVANCPLPSHTSKDSAFSFAVNVEKNLWTCHSDSCQKGMGMKGGDVIDLVCLMEGTRTPLDGAKKLVEWFPNIGTVNGSGDVSKPVPVVPVLEANKPLAWALQKVNPEHPLIQSRGITVETAQLFGIGWFPGTGTMAGRVVFPLHENNSLVGYAGRLVGEPTADSPKWKLSPIRKTFLYGLERCDPAKLLIIGESLWCPPFFYQQGAQAASIMGCELSEAQEASLEPFATIVIAMDNDAKGKEATQKIANRLRGKHKVFKSTLME